MKWNALTFFITLWRTMHCLLNYSTNFTTAKYFFWKTKLKRLEIFSLLKKRELKLRRNRKAIIKIAQIASMQFVFTTSPIVNPKTLDASTANVVKEGIAFPNVNVHSSACCRWKAANAKRYQQAVWPTALATSRKDYAFQIAANATITKKVVTFGAKTTNPPWVRLNWRELVNLR